MSEPRKEDRKVRKQDYMVILLGMLILVVVKIAV